MGMMRGQISMMTNLSRNETVLVYRKSKPLLLARFLLTRLSCYNPMSGSPALPNLLKYIISGVCSKEEEEEKTTLFKSMRISSNTNWCQDGTLLERHFYQSLRCFHLRFGSYSLYTFHLNFYHVGIWCRLIHFYFICVWIYISNLKLTQHHIPYTFASKVSITDKTNRKKILQTDVIDHKIEIECRK